MIRAQMDGWDESQPLTPQQHHRKAAEYHEQAAKYHREAARYHESGDPQTAAHHAQIAYGHTIQAIEQGTEVSKQYANTHSLQKL